MLHVSSFGKIVCNVVSNGSLSTSFMTVQKQQWGKYNVNCLQQVSNSWQLPKHVNTNRNMIDTTTVMAIVRVIQDLPINRLKNSLNVQTGHP